MRREDEQRRQEAEHAERRRAAEQRAAQASHARQLAEQERIRQVCCYLPKLQLAMARYCKLTPFNSRVAVCSSHHLHCFNTAGRHISCHILRQVWKSFSHAKHGRFENTCVLNSDIPQRDLSTDDETNLNQINYVFSTG